jgi:SAM-dependent methyltransferase
VGTEETHDLRYDRVDGDPNLAVLVATMDATSEWEAIRRLRAWERAQLALTPGRRLLDVGCGPGHAAVILAEDLGDGGEIVGLDASVEMIAVARERARAARCRVRFTVGDALALDEPDDAFDAARSERTLQWLPDPRAAVDELARVVRPGGTVSLIDTDWSTLSIDVGDDDIARRLRSAMQSERGRPATVGGRLPELLTAAGLEVRAVTRATHTWDHWEPDESPAPHGCFSITSLADDLVDTDHLRPDERDRFVATIRSAAEAGRFSMALTMFAATARVPT